MALSSFRIKPILGLKNNVPPDDPTLFKFIGDFVALTHDTGGLNVDYERENNACTKAYGYQQWSASANSEATKCLGLFELYDGTNRDYIHFDNGKCFIYDANRNPGIKEDSASTTFANDNDDLYSIISFGGYMIFADRGEHTPYKWSNGDANLTKLIQSGTEYTFRYLVEFQRRIIGAYSDQTNGDLEIRWTDALPTWASLDFPAANQLYKPEGDDSITGIKKMGANACFLYGEESISRIDYYVDSTTPFQITQMVSTQGAAGHHSIVNVGGAHYFFNKNYGFCKYGGGRELLPISDDIEGDISGINAGYYNSIVGVAIPFTHEICWAVPLNANSTPTHLLFYNTKTGQWRKKEKATRYIDTWTVFADVTWNDLIMTLGTGATWNDCGAKTWAYYVSESPKLVSANTNGHLYSHTGETADTGAWDAYRIEPILDFGDKQRKDRLLEIWFSSAHAGDYSLHTWWRGGDTVSEVEAASWTALSDINLNNPAEAAVYLDQTQRLHQIKWGTDGASEKFVIPEITFNFIPQGRF